MINRRTVFVLGAGSSYPYGFPTGEGLVDEIISLVKEDRTLDAFVYNGCVDEDVKRFGRDLADSDAPSVDAFLEHRPDFLKIGKLAMCLSLIPKERDEYLTRSHRQDRHGRGLVTWYHYLWNEMAAPKGEFGRNQISFVTLNYDRSLERYFYLRLRAQHRYEHDKECLDELFRLRFVHVYGSLGDARFIEHPYGRPHPLSNEVQKAAERLRIIHEEVAEAQDLSDAVGLLHSADVICFLGFGFHRLNNQRLTLTRMAKDDHFNHQKWFASRYGLTEVEFRRRTSQFFNRFIHAGYIKGRVGEESDGALEVLRKLPVIE
jgi:hypothetical protein